MLPLQDHHDYHELKILEWKCCSWDPRSSLWENWNQILDINNNASVLLLLDTIKARFILFIYHNGRETPTCKIWDSARIPRKICLRNHTPLAVINWHCKVMMYGLIIILSKYIVPKNEIQCKKKKFDAKKKYVTSDKNIKTFWITFWLLTVDNLYYVAVQFKWVSKLFIVRVFIFLFVVS